MKTPRPYDVIAGSTIKLTWVNSGVTPSSIAATLRDKSESLISSMAASSSGDGQYYAIIRHPGSAQWVVNEWIAVINGNTYVNRQFGRVITGEVG
jgi:hypothetical protein